MTHKAALGMFLGLALAGCAVGPDYERPQMDLPEAWTEKPGISTSSAAVDERWWTLFGDPQLDALVDEALAYNRDLLAAGQRVIEAQERANIADTYLLPVISANAAVDETRSSLAGSFPPPPGVSRTTNNYRATLDVIWEIDLFGRYRRDSEAALARYFEQEAARESLRLSLVAQVCEQYFALLAVDGREAVVRRTLESRQETVGLFQKRLDAGVIPSYVLYQAQAEEAGVRVQLAQIRQARELQESALTVLLGRSPRAILDSSVARGAPAAPADVAVPAGLPSELLSRRPDLRQAEQNLVAANAEIGAVKSQIFPAITLTGFTGSESTSLSDLFTGPAGVYQFAAAIAQPIFTGGRNIYGVRAAEARKRQSMLGYQNAVANAFREVRDALSIYSWSRDVLAAESERVDALETTYGEITKRYEGGVSNRLEVLDTERQLLQAQLDRIDAQQRSRGSVAGLFKALGGGWTPPSTSDAGAVADGGERAVP